MIELGVIWYDDSNRPVEEKVKLATERFMQRTGQAATVCHINEADKNGIEQVGKVRLEVSRYCCPNHYYAGVE
jgi:hypothetical protein